MNANTQLLEISGPVGAIDVAFDAPDGAAVGAAVIAHPHPLYGGTRDNKVVQTIARALVSRGWACWRPNFRGVGLTEGTHDEGRGETIDTLSVIEAACEHPSVRHLSAPVPLVLAGFSFGSFVQSRVARELAQRGRPVRRMVLVGTAASRFGVEPVAPNTLVIHGEIDDVVPLSAVFEWARPQDLPVVVLPGADHFFNRKLTGLKRVIADAFGCEP
jgi:uncharacterized protein